MPHKEIKGIPSVTQVLDVLNKKFLLKWYADKGWAECERIKRESAEFGTRIHTQVSQWLKGEVPDWEDEILQDFQRQYAKTPTQPVEVEPEEPYISRKLGYQGTFDWVDTDGEQFFMNDLKVTGRIYPEMVLQLSAYAALWNEKHPEKKIKLGRIYRIDKKTGNVQVKEYKLTPELFKVFKSLLTVWRWQND